VRVILDAAELHLLERGEVLVCPITTPSWSVYFSRVGALVTDGGSVLSHAAIIAREHGVPAVVATGSATRTLDTGMRVEVDGSAGEVQVLAGA
jgi:pyruvate,water dikinase